MYLIHWLEHEHGNKFIAYFLATLYGHLEPSVATADASAGKSRRQGQKNPSFTIH